MPLWLIVVLVVLAVLILGGFVASRRRLVRTRPSFDARLAKINRDLAAALAEDRGWDPDGLERAARAAWAQQRPGEEPEAVTLHDVLDLPGKQEDKATFRFRAAGRDHLLTLGRTGDDWHFESLK